MVSSSANTRRLAALAWMRRLYTRMTDWMRAYMSMMAEMKAMKPAALVRCSPPRAMKASSAAAPIMPKNSIIGPGQLAGAGDPHELGEETAGVPAVLLRDDGFEVVGLDDADAAQGLVDAFEDGRRLVLDRLGRLADLAGVDEDGDRGRPER